MKILGLTITRDRDEPTGLQLSEKALIPSTATLANVPGSSSSGWFRILESVAGAWQRNVEVEITSVLTYAPVFACVRLIATDIAKLRLRLVKQDPSTGLWSETESPAFSPVLRKPNRYQGRIKFIQQWLISLLLHGNTYVLKQRDARGVVVAMYVLDPGRVRPLVAPDGSVYYALSEDNLTGITKDMPAVPASEIIHDVYLALYHPLVGVSPITACGIAAVEALRIQEASTIFFGNGSKPGGVLTAPGRISQDTAERLKAYWDENFAGENRGKVAVLGDGLKYEQMAVTATDAQLIEQLKWTAVDACQAFGVPPYKVNVGDPPNYNNIQALDIQYYSQCLQEKIEGIEELIDFGIGLAPDKIDGVRMGVEFDRNDLLQMDTAGRIDAATKAVGGVASPNEARRLFLDLPPQKGGDTVYMQQQYYSLEALAERDADQPFAKPTPAPAATPAAPDPDDEDDMPDEDVERELRALLRKELELVAS